MSDEDPHTVMHVYEGDGGVIIRDGGNISTFGVQSRAVMAAFDAASEEPAFEHSVLAGLAARLAKAERALEDAEKVIAPFAFEADQWPGYDEREALVESWSGGPATSLNVGHLRAARKWMEERHD